MIFHSFKAAFRNLLRYKLNASIIILSLTLSFSFASILLTFILHELNTDAFHHNKDQIYRLFSDDPFKEGSQLRYVTLEAAEFIQDHFPEIEAATFLATLDYQGLLPTEKEEVFDNLTILGTDSSFFQLFDYPVLEGDPSTAIRPDGVVLSLQAAKKILGQPPFVGETLELKLDSTSHLLTVTAVLSTPPENSQLQFDALLLLNHVAQQSGGTAYFLLNTQANVQALTEEINQNKEVPSLVGPGETQYHLEPFQQAYFNATNVQPYEQSRSKLIVWICSLVIFLISFAASFNFINLLIIGLMSRTKEIGVRKVLGASRSMLGLSLAIEVGLYVIIALMVSILLTVQLLPLFNLSFNTSLSTAYLLNTKVILIISGLIFSLALLVSLYLSYFSWRLNPISLLQANSMQRIKINRFLITAQFFISVGMIVCSVIVIKQMHFIESKPLGFNRHLIQLASPFEDQAGKLAALKQELLQYPQFSSVALASGNPISRNWMVRYALDSNNFYTPYLLSGDYDLIKTLHLRIVEGKAFSAGDNSGKLVNETLVRYFQMNDPIGETVPGTEDKIIGVVADFNSVSFKQEIPPYIISYNEKPDHLLIDASGKKLDVLIPLIEKCWQEVYPNNTFSYAIIEDELLAKHQEEIFFYRMMISFTIASVLISCFGLFGIATFTAAQRTKEIGIRKVLGASVFSILMLLSKDFTKLIIIAFVLAVPVANYFMSEWLQNFVFRIDISWGMFALPGVLILLIGWLSVSGQALKAAKQNPVDSLRDE